MRKCGMGTASFSIYHRRAMQLADAMRLCRDDLAAYASAAALLAVHSAISYNDAALVELGDRRPRGEDHREAIASLKHACTKAKIDHRGVTHLERLLSAKTGVAYGDRTVEDERILALCVAAERFEAWVERILQRRGGS